MQRSGAPYWLDPLEEGCSTVEVWPSRSIWTPYHALQWVGRLVESQEGLETKVGPRQNLAGAPGICFSISCFLLKLTQDGQRFSKPLKLGVEFFVRVSLEGHVFLFCFLILEPFVKRLLRISNILV
ncbi:hypothetical protein M9H77_26699 [Catharanthus roseus]|uniref:Uncharacterized protein n=1 Tax=Catharanthus roseus TaxID=4058 RepID=A0ACC0ABE3_CATRO|nr:hypothetical protein M9H77_26699 [Catharanthus roseus]